MKKIILALIISLFLVNFSFANEEKCLIETDRDYWEKSDDFKNCEKDEKILNHKKDKNGNYIFISEVETENNSKIKINNNSKIIFEKNFSIKKEEKIKVFSELAFSKYKNHSLILLKISKYEIGTLESDGDNFEIEKNEKFFDEINGVYLDGFKISKNTTLKNFLDFAGEILFKLEIKFFEEKNNTGYINKKMKLFLFEEKNDTGYINKKMKLFLDDEEFLYIDFENEYSKKEFETFLEISKYLKRKSFLNENKYFVLDENFRKILDNSLEKNIFQNKENIKNIDFFLETLDKKQRGFNLNQKTYEVIDYIKSELKIFKLKNS